MSTVNIELERDLWKRANALMDSYNRDEQEGYKAATALSREAFLRFDYDIRFHFDNHNHVVRLEMFDNENNLICRRDR